jgi:transcription elongation factor Elf1
MMLMNYVDSKFINLISVYLERFKAQNAELFNFRCPICGDSKKNKSKTRGYLYTFDDVVAFRCHNCGASMSLGNFIKHFSVDLWKQYCFERFFNGEKRTIKQREKDGRAEANRTETVHAEADSESTLSNWAPISSLEEEHHAKKYIRKRRIPEVFHHELYYTDDLRTVFKAIPRYSERIPANACPALLIPFFNDDSTLHFIQARTLISGEGSNPRGRYQTFQLVELGKKIWGLDRVDWNKHVWVFEGPIDAMMVDNGIAVAGGTLTAEIKYLKEKCKAGFTFVFDNDYKTNYEVFHHFIKSIEQGIPVVFYDKNFPYKDMNEAVQDGWSKERLTEYLTRRARQGLSAQLALSEFKHPIQK